MCSTGVYGHMEKRGSVKVASGKDLGLDVSLTFKSSPGCPSALWTPSPVSKMTVTRRRCEWKCRGGCRCGLSFAPIEMSQCPFPGRCTAMQGILSSGKDPWASLQHMINMY